MSNSGPDTPETIIPFPSGGDPLDRTGQTILGLLQRAAAIAEKNSQHALGVAHKLSLELRAAEDHIKKLEADLWHYQQRSERADEWMRQISMQIENKFFGSGNTHPSEAPPRQASPQDYAPRKSGQKRT